MPQEQEIEITKVGKVPTKEKKMVRSFQAFFKQHRESSEERKTAPSK
jgi:hypothetical protein